MSWPCSRAGRILASVLLFVACDEGRPRMPPEIIDLSAPSWVAVEEKVLLLAHVRAPPWESIEAEWSIAGSGAIRGGSLTSGQVILAQAVFRADSTPGLATVQLVVTSSEGFDYAEATVHVGNEVPYLSRLYLAHEDGSVQPIEVPSPAAEVSVRPGERFELVAEAIDYEDDPPVFYWTVANDSLTEPCASLSRTFNVMQGQNTARVEILAPDELCSLTVSLRISDAKSRWEEPVVTVRVAVDPPVIERIVVPNAVEPGDSVEVSAEVASDQETTVAYQWWVRSHRADLQHTSYDSSVAFTVLDGADTYSVCLSVEDRYGQSDSECEDLVVPSDWHHEADLASTPYLGVEPPNDVYTFAFRRSEGYVVAQHFDRQTQEVTVLGSAPIATMGDASSCEWFVGLGATFYCEQDLSLFRFEAGTLTRLDWDPMLGPLFSAAGQLWQMIDSTATMAWQRLDGDAWTRVAEATTDGGQVEVATGDAEGYMLLLLPAASTATVLECDVSGGCQDAGSIQASLAESARGFARTSDGRPILLYTSGVWAREVSGDWVQHQVPVPESSIVAWAVGGGRACLVEGRDVAWGPPSVWCYVEAGWSPIGRRNIDDYCGDAALAVAGDTVYLLCNGRLHTHPL